MSSHRNYKEKSNSRRTSNPYSRESNRKIHSSKNHESVNESRRRSEIIVPASPERPRTPILPEYDAIPSTPDWNKEDEIPPTQITSNKISEKRTQEPRIQEKIDKIRKERELQMKKRNTEEDRKERELIFRKAFNNIKLICCSICHKPEGIRDRIIINMPCCSEPICNDCISNEEYETKGKKYFGKEISSTSFSWFFCPFREKLGTECSKVNWRKLNNSNSSIHYLFEHSFERVNGTEYDPKVRFIEHKFTS